MRDWLDSIHWSFVLILSPIRLAERAVSDCWICLADSWSPHRRAFVYWNACSADLCWTPKILRSHRKKLERTLFSPLKAITFSWGWYDLHFGSPGLWPSLLHTLHRGSLLQLFLVCPFSQHWVHMSFLSILADRSGTVSSAPQRSNSPGARFSHFLTVRFT